MENASTLDKIVMAAIVVFSLAFLGLMIWALVWIIGNPVGALLIAVVLLIGFRPSVLALPLLAIFAQSKD